MTPEKQNRRAQRQNLQDKIAKALANKKYVMIGGVVLFRPSQVRAMAKQMSQGRHPAMGIDWGK